MKKIILILLFCSICTLSYAASEKVYLKCKEIVTKNKSTGSLADIYAEGNFGHIILPEIIIGKKSSKITVYRPIPDFENIEQSFNKKLDFPIVTKRKAIVEGNSYTGEDIVSKTASGGNFEAIARFTFTKSGNNWSVKARHLLRGDTIDINYIAEGDCVVVDKKYYKNIIKKGPTQTDLEF